jgi:hypothetical protein
VPQARRSRQLRVREADEISRRIFAPPTVFKMQEMPRDPPHFARRSRERNKPARVLTIAP